MGEECICPLNGNPCTGPAMCAPARYFAASTEHAQRAMGADGAVPVPFLCPISYFMQFLYRATKFGAAYGASIVEDTMRERPPYALDQEDGG